MDIYIPTWVLCIAFLRFTANGYVIDDSNGLERTFDGIGGLSGGGATSKLLLNYPEKQRNEVLDYLFLPNFGASLHILKVEIGGDTQSTEGTESSHQHEEWDENYTRGYEWWLMKEAKKRNPAIKLYGLPWGFPGWLGNGTGSPYAYPETTAKYILRWVEGAKRVHGLDIDYIGIWNERPYNITYIEVLRSTLNAAGLSNIKMVASDGGWDISNDIIKQAALAKSVDIVGCHYPGTNSSALAQQTGKPLWASEDFSTYNDNSGAGCWARILNQNYVNGYMTSTISWNLLAAYYDDLPFARCALMTANQPWSGNYDVTGPLWITAHTTQFTLPGDQYLKHGSGVGHLDQGGSYVTLKSADATHVTLVIETASHDHSKCIRPFLPAYNVTNQTASFTLKGSFQKVSELQVWFTQIGFNGQPSTWFKKMDPIKVVNGTFSLSLAPDQVYTLTTITDRGQHGAYTAPPAPQPFPLPYTDTYQNYTEFNEPFNFMPQAGVWEIRNVTSNFRPRGRLANMQVMQQPPIYWCNTGNRTLAVGGNYSWTDVVVQMTVTVPSVNGTEGAYIATRVTKGGCGMATTAGLFFWIYPTHTGIGSYYMLSRDLEQKNVLLKEPGAFMFDQPYQLGLLVAGRSVRGYAGMSTLFVQDLFRPAKNGFVGYGTSNFGQAVFEDFSIDKV